MPATTSASCSPAGYFCDPQVGCSDRLILEDLSDEHAWQLSQEFRIASNFSGPFNFSAGGNYLHYETEENYYVFGNVLHADRRRLSARRDIDSNTNSPLPYGFQFNDPTKPPHIAERLCRSQSDFSVSTTMVTIIFSAKTLMC